MEILRLKREIIKLNSEITIDKDIFSDKNKYIDRIELDNSLFAIALAKYEGVNQNEILFTDAIVKVEFEDDRDIIDRIITINNSRYAFYMATASDLKKSSCFFIKEQYYDFGEYLKQQATGYVEHILKEKDSVSIMKELAYQGFIFSGALKTNIIPKVVIIEEPKYIYRGLHTVLEGVEKAQDINDISLVEKEIQTTLTAFDGQGIADTKLMNKITKDLNIDYDLSWITFRLYAGIGGKGVATTVDIEKELLKVHKRYGDTEHLKIVNGELMIRDIWNVYHKVSEIDMILNESQCKLVKHFDSNYLNNISNSIDDIFKFLYICKYNPKNLRNDRTRLNYQFLQALNITYEELIKLTEIDREHLNASLNDIDSLLITCDLSDIQDIEDIEDKKKNDSFSLTLELLKYDSELLKDWSIQEHIKKILKSRINKLSYGKTFLNDASYRLAIQDPQVYMNFIATRNIDTARTKECLQDGEFYSIGRPDKQKTVIGRNPLSSHQELVKFENKKNSYIDSLGYKCNSMIVYNTYDATMTIKNSGGDFDGDLVCSIVDDIIYNSVIELDTPLFFNTFDGNKIELPYTNENIKSMIKKCSGNFIGNLALINAGIMNTINEYPYILQDGTLLTNNEFYNKVKNEYKLIDNQEIASKIQELLDNGIVVDAMVTTLYTPEQKKEFIKSRHKELRKLQYLILYAQQVAIDTSKTGIEIPENIQNILKKFTEKPYFFKYARGTKRGLTIRNSVIDRFSYDCSKYYYAQSFNLLNEICFTVEDDIKQSKKNIFIEMFNRIDTNINENNVQTITNELKNMYDNYKLTRKSLRNTDKTKNYYKSMHEDNNYNAYSVCDKWYKICSQNKDDYKLEELYKAMVNVNFRNDFILNYFPYTIVEIVKANNPKVKRFYKGEYPEKDGAKTIIIGNKVYSMVYEVIDENKLAESILNLRFKHIQKELQNNSNMLTLKFKADTVNLSDYKECIAIKNNDEYSYSLFVNDKIIVDKAYLYKNKVSFNTSNEVRLTDIQFNKKLIKNDEYICMAV